MSQQYVGTKIITAWEAEKEGRPGYGVQYADGYTSWSPKEIFEAAYIPLGHIVYMPVHQQRVMAEFAELNARISKLLDFFSSDVYASLPLEERNRLSNQSLVMLEYSKILGERIAAFEVKS